VSLDPKTGSSNFKLISQYVISYCSNVSIDRVKNYALACQNFYIACAVREILFRAKELGVALNDMCGHSHGMRVK
jgi:hypothetical protein